MEIEKINPGIWKLSFGTPEKLSPITLGYRKIKKDGYDALPAAAEPFDFGGIGFQTTSSGCAFELPLDEDEAVFGFGLQFKTFNHTGGKRTMRPNADPRGETGDSHAPVPFYVTTKGYGVFVDTLRYASFYCGGIKKKGSSVKRMLVEIPTAKGADVYVFAGPDMKSAVCRYNLFSGGGCLPPMWGLGVWYRAFGKFDCAHVKALMERFRAEGIPCDVIGLEPGWQSHAYSCSYVWDAERGSGHEALIDHADKNGFHVNLWEHAFVHPTSPIYEKLKTHSGDYEVWGGLVPDFADGEAVKIFGEYHRDTLTRKGIDGFKLDECDGSDYTGGWSFPSCAKYPSGLDGEQMHSCFGILYKNMMNDVFEGDGKRTYNSVRNSHAFAAPMPYVLYSDLYDHEEFIRGTVTMGFSGLLWSPEVRHAESVEDLVRRVQSVILSPQALINAWYIPLPPWEQIDTDKNNRGEIMAEAETAKSLIKKAFELRMSLIPYLYTAFAEYARTGLPPFRALVMDYPNDPEAMKIDNQYLIGDNLMAAPLIAGRKTSKIYVPKGDWYFFGTGEKAENGWIEKEYALDEIPLFVRGGTILPLAEPVPYVAADTVFEIAPRVYGNGPKPCRLFEDDGVSFDYRDGKYNLCEISFADGSFDMKRAGNGAKERYRLRK